MTLPHRVVVIVLGAMLQQGCATYIKGDLAEHSLRRGYFPATISNLNESDLDASSAHQPTTKVLLHTLQSQAHSPSNCFVEIGLDYHVRDNVFQSDIMPLLTTITLGLIPLYSTSDADVHATVKKGEKLLLDTTIDARAHTFYGWLAIYWANRTHSPDLVDSNESEGTDYFVLRETRRRVLWRISEILDRQNNGRDLCEPSP